MMFGPKIVYMLHGSVCETLYKCIGVYIASQPKQLQVYRQQNPPVQCDLLRWLEWIIDEEDSYLTALKYYHVSCHYPLWALLLCKVKC